MNLHEWCKEIGKENLLEEWNYERNGKLTPMNVSPKSHAKVWWLGKCGHEWDAVVSSRSNGTNCPICSGKRIIKGENDLETLYPTIAAEWNLIKNGESEPNDFRPMSNKRVWWECPMCGHEWQARICKRVIGQACPECAKEWKISFPEKAIVYYLLKLELQLEENYSAEWLKELDLDIYIPEFNIGITYDGPLHNNAKKEYRKNELCIDNNTFLIRICDKKSIEVESPYGISIRRADNKDFSLNESIMMLLKEVGRMCDKKIPEKLVVDVERDRIEIYELMKMHRKRNSIVNKYPKLLKEWNYEKNGKVKPEYLLPGSEKKVWWKCSEYGHEWQAIINSRTRGTGCPVCSNNRVEIGFNDLASHYPQLAAEWHPTKNYPLTPESITKKSRKTVWWMCLECKNEWEAAVYSRSGKNPNGCPKCGLKKNISSLRIPKQGNSLKERNNKLSAEWHPQKNYPYTPDTISFKSHLKAWWKCSICDYEWEAMVSSRSNGNGCPNCYKNRRLKDKLI